MARLSHAIEAYSIKRESPSVIMRDVADFFGTEREGIFATVICGLVDVPGHEVTLVNAGHPAPILITSEDAEPLSSVTSPPVGLAGAEFEATTVAVPRGATLVAFSDGLFEQRGEVLDIGLDRLRSIANAGRSQTLDSLLDAMVNGAGTTRSDDTALLGIRRKS
jgi:serine phosphatase RsbU (regulator of sigma subunit)